MRPTSSTSTLFRAEETAAHVADEGEHAVAACTFSAGVNASSQKQWSTQIWTGRIDKEQKENRLEGRKDRNRTAGPLLREALQDWEQGCMLSVLF